MKEVQKRLPEWSRPDICRGWAERAWPESYFAGAFGQGSPCTCAKLLLSIDSIMNRSCKPLQNFRRSEWLRSRQIFQQSCGLQTRKRLRKPIRYGPPLRKSLDEP